MGRKIRQRVYFESKYEEKVRLFDCRSRPFNMNTFNRLWNVKTPAEARLKIAEQRAKYDKIYPANLEEQALKMCGNDIYQYFIKGYTEKQWGKPATELPSSIIKRIPFRFVFDNNYYDDPCQGIPIGGYNPIIANMLSKAEVMLNTDYFNDKETFDKLTEKIVYTGCIDEFFDYRFGRLEYRSLRFEHKRMETDNYQGNAVINYTGKDIPYTRIIEHKHFDFGQQPFTVVTYEYPEDYQAQNDPYYPINDTSNIRKYEKYKDLSASYPNIMFGGRLGQYSYLDMDDTIESALLLASKELPGENKTT